MKILVINSGSSSIKYQVVSMPEKDVICKGQIERIGLSDGVFTFKTKKHNIRKITEIENHEKGLELISNIIIDDELGIVDNANEIDAVGHRVVHGGSNFSKTTIINQEVKDKIKLLSTLAPLHNPPNLKGIIVAEKFFPNSKQIAVFDTAFHQTLPEVAYRYAIKNSFLIDHKIRVYGFHGTSHKYVSEKAIKYLGKNKSKIITIHLGNGCSMTAIKDGKSVEHTLGFGPMNGLIMGTRSGDIDQSVIFYMVNTLGYKLDEVNNILQKQSGMLGLTGYSDLREIELEAKRGNKECQLGLEMNAYRIKKFIGSFASIMNGLDAIIFTAGIGENSSVMRSLVCNEMDFLGIILDSQKNANLEDDISEINKLESRVKILVIPTNEEIEIAKQSYSLIK